MFSSVERCKVLYRCEFPEQQQVEGTRLVSWKRPIEVYLISNVVYVFGHEMFIRVRRNTAIFFGSNLATNDNFVNLFRSRQCATYADFFSIVIFGFAQTFTSYVRRSQKKNAFWWDLDHITIFPENKIVFGIARTLTCFQVQFLGSHNFSLDRRSNYFSDNNVSCPMWFREGTTLSWKRSFQKNIWFRRRATTIVLFANVAYENTQTLTSNV